MIHARSHESIRRITVGTEYWLALTYAAEN